MWWINDVRMESGSLVMPFYGQFIFSIICRDGVHV